MYCLITNTQFTKKKFISIEKVFIQLISLQNQELDIFFREVLDVIFNWIWHGINANIFVNMLWSKLTNMLIKKVNIINL